MAPSRASAVREGGGEASVGVHAGGGDRAAKFRSSGVPTLSAHAEGNIAGSAIRELSADPTRSQNPGMRGVSGRENREI